MVIIGDGARGSRSSFYWCCFFISSVVVDIVGGDIRYWVEVVEFFGFVRI